MHTLNSYQTPSCLNLCLSPSTVKQKKIRKTLLRKNKSSILNNQNWDPKVSPKVLQIFCQIDKKMKLLKYSIDHHIEFNITTKIISTIIFSACILTELEELEEPHFRYVAVIAHVFEILISSLKCHCKETNLHKFTKTLQFVFTKIT